MRKIIVSIPVLGVCKSTFDVKIKEMGTAEQYITASCTKVSRMNNEMFLHGLSNVHPR